MGRYAGLYVQPQAGPNLATCNVRPNTLCGSLCRQYLLVQIQRNQSQAKSAVDQLHEQ